MESLNETLLAETPALQPPPGVIPNFVDPYSLRPFQIAVTVSCSTVASLVIAARFITKFSGSRSLRLEEYASIFSWLLFLAYCILSTVLTNLGNGRHQWDLSVLAFMNVIRLMNITETLYPPLIFTAKLLILVQYLRIFVPSQRGFTYWATHVLIWANFMFYVAILFVVIFECSPREKIWNRVVPGTCVNVNMMFIITGAWNVFSDFSILILPIRAIWLLQMPSKKKWQVSAVFAMGLFACIASILRLYYSVVYLGTPDANFVIVQVGLWSQAEATTVIICGALPIMPQFLNLVKNKLGRVKISAYGYFTHNKELPSNVSATEVSRENGKAPWLERNGPDTRPPGDYIPLEEHYWPVNQTTTVGVYALDRGSSPRSDPKGEKARKTSSQSEVLYPEAGIVRTVRIETDSRLV